MAPEWIASARGAFDRASAAYEKSAVLQAQVGDELLQRLDFFKLSPDVVVDLGSGTGRVTGELKRRYRRAQVVALDIAPGMLREARRQKPFGRRRRGKAHAITLHLSGRYGLTA